MTSAAPDILGHPRGIFVLFFVEMWERFSYYGMRALLILYLIQHFAMSDARATALYGAYTAMVYGVAVLGGWAADKLIGRWRSIVIGAALILCGHLGLVIEGMFDPALASTQQLFFLALALIVTGTGLFKPNSTSLVGALYPAGDIRKANGFYIFYVGINLGSALAALICGWLGQRYGWSYGFGAAALGMATGLAILILFRADLTISRPPREARSVTGAIAVVMLGIAGCWYLVQHPNLVGVMLVAALIIGLIVVGRFMAKDATRQEQLKLRSALILIAAASVFWSLFEQAGSSLNLFAARVVDLSVGPVALLSSQTQFFNPAFILLLTPAFAWLWVHLAKTNHEPSVTWKHVLGLIQVGLGFLCLVIGIASTGDNNMVPLGWLALAYLLHTTGELCLSPPAYAAMTDLAPSRIAGLVMGLWLFSLSIGNFIGAKIAGLTARPESGLNNQAIELRSYSDVFSGVVLAAGIAALLLALLAPRMNRWTRGEP